MIKRQPAVNGIALIIDAQCFREVLEMVQYSRMRQRYTLLQAGCTSRMLNEGKRVRRNLHFRRFCIVVLVRSGGA